MFVTIMLSLFSVFFFNDTATTEIYTLSLHDALPISSGPSQTGHLAIDPNVDNPGAAGLARPLRRCRPSKGGENRSEEHTSELQSRQYLVCRLLLEKKKKKNTHLHYRLTNRSHTSLLFFVHQYSLHVCNNHALSL